MATKPKRLGKGLGALMKAPVVVEPDPRIAEPINTDPVEPSKDVPRGTSRAVALAGETTTTMDATQSREGPGGRMLPVDSIRPNPAQPRRHFDADALKTLSDSIQTHGLIQPVVVRYIEGSSPAEPRWELVAGERRWRAAKLAGMSAIPAIVREMDDKASAEVALIENLQREDLNVVERATALRELCSRFGLTHAQVSERVGLDRSSVTNLLRLLDLDEAILEELAVGRLSMGHGRALLAELEPARRGSLANETIRQQWSVRELERRIKNGAPQPTSTSRSVSPAIADLEKRLGDRLGTKVAIKTDRTGKKGSMTLAFYGLEHFESVLDRMGLADQAM